MTAEQLHAIGPQFTAFVQPFERFFDTAASVRHFRHYARGLLSDLPRKTAEPLALAAGTPPRCLQQFLKACLWDHDGLTDALQRTLLATVADLPPDPVGTVGILDETSARKQGTKTPPPIALEISRSRWRKTRPRSPWGEPTTRSRRPAATSSTSSRLEHVIPTTTRSVCKSDASPTVETARISLRRGKRASMNCRISSSSSLRRFR